MLKKLAYRKFAINFPIGPAHGTDAVWPDWAIFFNFRQLFKAFGNNLFAQISHILRHFFKGVKIFNFSSEIIFGQLL